MNELKSKIIKQRWIIVVLSVVITAAFTTIFGAFTYLSLTLSNEVDELQELNDTMRIHLVEKDARIELLEGQIDVLEDDR